MRRSRLLGVATGAVAAALTLSGGAARAQDVTIIRLSPQVVPTIAPGSLLRFDVWLENPKELGAFQLTVGYPEDNLTLESVTLGPLLGSTGREVIELPLQEQPGGFTYGAVSSPGFPGASVSGVIATIAYRVTVAGRGEVAIDSATAQDTENKPMPLVIGRPARVSVHTGIFIPFALKQ